MTRIGGVLLVALALAGAGASAHGGAAPKTLVDRPGAIRAFAQDGNAIAYIASNHTVHVQRVAGRGRWVVGSAAGSYANQVPPFLALAGTRAVWTQYVGGNIMEILIDTGVPAASKAKRVDLLRRNSISTYGGDFVGGLAGDGKTLVYGWASICDVGDSECSRFQVSGGGARRVSAGSKTTIAGVPPLVDLALSQGRIAVVPADLGTSPQLDDRRVPLPVENGPVRVYDLAGRLLSGFTPSGTVRDVALSWPQAAVLVQRGDGMKAIERYDAKTGALVDANAVPAAATDLSLSSTGAVYRVGGAIYLLARGGQQAIVWKVAGTPIGLSIEGHRIAWAVNGPHRALVRALTIGSSGY